MNSHIRFIVAGNWKLNKSPRETLEFLKAFAAIRPPSAMKERDCMIECVIFPSALSASVVAGEASELGLKWGGQNMHSEVKGAFTGENSGQFLVEMGARYVLIGHSERRQIFHEDSPLLAKKLQTAQTLGLIPVFCIGETLEQRKASETVQILQSQLAEGLSTVDLNQPLVIAYEPVWAIGTGVVATPEQVRETHHEVRRTLIEVLGQTVGEMTPILYGGSVTVENAAGLKQVEHVNGFLIGGASLDPRSFATLCSI